MILSHRIALDPADAQRKYFAKACGVSRFVWNLAIEECERRLLLGRDRVARNKDIKRADSGAQVELIPDDELIDAFKMRKAFNEFKDYAFPFLKETHRDCYTQPFAYAERAYKAYFKDPTKTGRPKFKKKGRCRDSFYVANNTVNVNKNRIRLPRIGWIKTHEELRFSGKVMGATVSRTADRWFIAIMVDVGENKKKRTEDAPVGVDVGISKAVALSTGETIKAPKPLEKALKKIRRVSRTASRQTRGGKNQKKTYRKLARIHARVASIRRDFWHKITTRLCRENQAIGIETLNVKGMARNKKLARALTDVGFGAMAPMLEYKSRIYDCVLHKTDQWFASSKTCSCCGYALESLDLRTREWTCPQCGAHHDRDVNAAKNEKSELVKFLASQPEKILPVGQESEYKPADLDRGWSSAKQEAFEVGVQQWMVYWEDDTTLVFKMRSQR